MSKNIISSDNILTYIKNILLNESPELDIHNIDINTDLIAYGVESIQILSILSCIEEEFKLEINLEELEKNDFIISAEIIAGFKD